MSEIVGGLAIVRPQTKSVDCSSPKRHTKIHQCLYVEKLQSLYIGVAAKIGMESKVSSIGQAN